MRSRQLIAACALGLCACAARGAKPPQTAAATTEYVIDEGSVVSVRPRVQSRDGSELPPWPDATSPAAPEFRDGVARAEAVLATPGPNPPAADDQASYDAWLKAELEPWLQARATAVETALRPLAQSTAGPPREQTVTAALIGLLYAGAHDQLLQIPPPPAVRADEKLLHIYLDQVNKASQSWIDGATNALRHCATVAAAQRDSSFVPWLDRCQAELARLEQQLEAASTLAQTVIKEREAETAVASPSGDAASAAPAATPDAAPVAPNAAAPAPGAPRVTQP